MANRPGGDPRTEHTDRADRRDRAVAPLVGKLLEIGLVVLFLSGVAAGLYGGVLPEYRTDAGAEVADRTLAAAATEVEAAVPPDARTARVERTVDVPATIRGDGYRLVVDAGRLRLEHPRPGIGGETRLALPDRVDRIEGAWTSGATTVVVVESTPDGLAVRLENR